MASELWTHEFSTYIDNNPTYGEEARQRCGNVEPDAETVAANDNEGPKMAAD